MPFCKLECLNGCQNPDLFLEKSAIFPANRLYDKAHRVGSRGSFLNFEVLTIVTDDGEGAISPSLEHIILVVACCRWL